MQEATASLALLLKRLAQMLLFFSATPSANQKLWAAVHTVHRAEMFEVKPDRKELAESVEHSEDGDVEHTSGEANANA